MTNCTDPQTRRLRGGRITRHATWWVLATLALGACSAPGPHRQAPASGGNAPSAVNAVSPAPAAAQADAEADHRFQEALALMKSGRLQEAQDAFLALSRDYPRLSGPLTDLGILYAQARHRELAMEAFGRAVALNPDNAVAHNWLGTLYREAGDFARAERAYHAAIAAESRYAQAHLNLGILYDVALHQPEQALTAYRRYQDLSGDDSLIVEAWIRDLQARIEARRASPQSVTEVAGAGR